VADGARVDHRGRYRHRARRRSTDPHAARHGALAGVDARSFDRPSRSADRAARALATDQGAFCSEPTVGRVFDHRRASLPDVGRSPDGTHRILDIALSRPRSRSHALRRHARVPPRPQRLQSESQHWRERHLPGFASWLARKIFERERRFDEVRVGMERGRILARGEGFEPSGEFDYVLVRRRDEVLP
jgi:hypothetical protein